MKVILTQEVLGLGDPGQIVTVKNGYGRNYLIPQGMALEATSHNLVQIEAERKRLEAELANEAEKHRSEAEKLADVSLTLTAKAGPGGKLYGSITNMDIAKTLAKQDIEIDRRRIILEGPLKQVGSYKVKVKLHPHVFAEFEVKVEAEGGMEPPADQDQAAAAEAAEAAEPKAAQEAPESEEPQPPPEKDEAPEEAGEAAEPEAAEPKEK
ncbi:MAG: 50S ribosomal protein L9 [Desulfarculaceae bacterium]|jgi:large subunit ribosomal protein L9